MDWLKLLALVLLIAVQGCCVADEERVIRMHQEWTLCERYAPPASGRWNECMESVRNMNAYWTRTP